MSINSVMPKPTLQAHNVCFAYSDGTVAIRDVSLTVEEGEFVALVGRSGIGKSTLLRILGGLLQPQEGHITHNNDQSVGIVFQNHNLMPWRTVAQNVELPLEISGTRNSERVRQMLDLVGLAGVAQSHPAQLSGGMAQRVAIARALVHDPDILLLDEPFGSLDALTRERMGMELVHIRQAHPITVFMVTHSIDEAVLLADKVCVMGSQPGTIVATVPIDLPHPRRLEMRYSSAFQAMIMKVRALI